MSRSSIRRLTVSSFGLERPALSKPSKDITGYLADGKIKVSLAP